MYCFRLAVIFTSLLDFNQVLIGPFHFSSIPLPPKPYGTVLQCGIRYSCNHLSNVDGFPCIRYRFIVAEKSVCPSLSFFSIDDIRSQSIRPIEFKVHLQHTTPIESLTPSIGFSMDYFSYLEVMDLFFTRGPSIGGGDS